MRSRKTRRLDAICGMAAILVMLSCSLVFTEPSVRVAGVRVASLGITSGVAEVVVSVDNPNRFGLEVRSLDYALQVEDDRSETGWSELSRGSSVDTVRVEGGDSTRVSLRIPFQYEALGAALQALLERGSVAYQVQGSALVHGPTGEVQVPFREAGTLSP